MGKISPVSAKYIIHTQIQIDGAVDKPDVIGAIFGQTEGLLGNELELRELQRSGRIGRIEVNIDSRNGKSNGEIVIPSSLDKAETAIIGAALETIQRIGPCNSKLFVNTIEDIRISKRDFVIERAKQLLKDLTSKVLPDSQEITDQVSQSVRMMEITEYGIDNLPAGPNIDESDELIVVEGRADVLNLLKHGIKNVIAVNGANVPETIKELSKKKTLILFVDGDRGGEIIIKGLINSGVEADYVVMAPDGKEVEEITKKEIHKALRSKITLEQVKMELGIVTKEPVKELVKEKQILAKPDHRRFKEMLDDLVGSRAAFVLNENLELITRVPLTELSNAIKEIKEPYAIVFDGYIDKPLVNVAEKSGVRCLAGMRSRVNPQETKIELITSMP